MDSQGRSGGLLPMNNELDSKTVLMLFVGVVVVFIYLFSVLLVVVRRAKKLIELYNRRYYLVIVFYVASKLIICSVLTIQMIVGVANSWENLSSDSIELMIKTGLVLADFALIELFLISLEHYFGLCLSTMKDKLSLKQSRFFSLALRTFQVIVFLVMMIPLLILDFTDMSYDVLNGIGLSLNLLVLLFFLATFFYFNFKMTGVLVEERLNQVIKRVYKVHLVILVSRIFMITFEMLVAIYVHGSFQEQINTLSDKIEYEIVLALLFIGSILFQLFTEGLPVMYSMRSNVLQAMNFRPSLFEYKESIFTSHTSDLEHSLLENNLHEAEKEDEPRQMRLKHFKQVSDVQGTREQSIWVIKRGSLDKKQYIIRISKHEISSYIFEDIENEIDLWNQLNIPSLSKVSYFYEGQIIHIVERYYQICLDRQVDMLTQENELIGLGLKLAQAIHELHANQLIHGCLSPGHVFVEKQKIVLNGCGLHSMRKYLSLITGYTNKTMYTAIEHLRDKNNVILKPKRPADVYSFGLLLYEIVTKNRQYRQLSLREVTAKFAEENFRPKLPENIKPELKVLIRKCWHQNADKRPELEEVIEQLKRLL